MLSFDQVSHRFADHAVLADISFIAAAGEITCLLGASGCGKTTLLRLAAGLLRLQSGAIALDGVILPPERPPERRPISLVFQEGALFPHLTVAQNVGFGVARQARAESVSTLLAQVQLEGLGDRLPHALSGGQRQRVGLARALATAPRALLFDEPYANLDMNLRRQLREDARQTIRERGAVGLFVTHDPEEVMAIADRVVVLDRGRVSQAGPPGELYDSPATLEIASMFGCAQRLRGTLQGDVLETPFGRWSRACLVRDDWVDGSVELVVRALDLSLAPARQGPTIREIRRTDGDFMLHLEVPSAPRALQVQCAREAMRFTVGDTVSVTPAPGRVFVAAGEP